jgi:hypothetical protein
MTNLPTVLLLTSLARQLEESFHQDCASDLRSILELAGARAANVARWRVTDLLANLSSERLPVRNRISRMDKMMIAHAARQFVS